MIKASGIYRVELGNGWFYVGSAKNLSMREGRHRSGLKCGKHKNIKMQNVWNKYQMFEFIILEECEINDLIVREQFYLNQYFNDPKNANLAPIAGSSLGVIYSDESKAKLSAANKGKTKGVPKSAEHRAKISAANKGVPKSAEQRAKMSARVVTAETRAKMSAWQIGRVLPAETRAKLSARVYSDETKAKMSASQKLRWAQKGKNISI